ncbi:MAG: hypothetical protein ISR69_11000 [Gammaproteobacteria bacterium]|nr:hypothetical protein [Gammaproteobacteria bacterium]
MNIISAIMTHYFISQNNTLVNSIDTKIQKIETQIKSLWQAKTEMEQKKDFILLLLSSQPKSISPTILNYLNQYLDSINKRFLNSDKRQSLSIETTIALTQKAQKKLINEINDQYLIQSEYVSSKKPIQENTAALYSIAIFMQLIGLILVLSRDLSKA